MLFRRSKLERLYDARIEDLKAEHRRMVTLMAEEIEFLRRQLAGPQLGTVRGADVKVFDEPDFMPDPSRSPHSISEEEEDLLALRDGGHITEMEYRGALAQIQTALGGVPIDVETD